MDNEQDRKETPANQPSLAEPPEGVFSPSQIPTENPEERKPNYSLEVDDHKGSFLWNVHQYLNQYIQFADGKAAASFTATSALLIWLLTRTKELSSLCSQSTTNTYLVWIGIISLAVSCTFAISVFLPRLWSSHKKGIIYWGEVAAFRNSEEYLAALHSRGFALNDEIGRHVYVLSTIAKAKFRDVTWAIVLAILGVLFLAHPIWLLFR